MKSPVIDKVARRRSAVAILISLLALWIAMQGVDAVRANFEGLALTTIVTLPLILVYVGAIFLLLQTPKWFHRLNKFQPQRNSTGKTDPTATQNKSVEATAISPPDVSVSTSPPPHL